MSYWLTKNIYLHLPAFKSRNFRLFFSGQTLSLSGTFMTQVTISWLIYDLTHSAWLLGLTGFLQFLPTLILTPFSGVFSDRWSRRNLLMLVQVLGFIVSFTLSTLTFLEDDKRGRVMSLYSLAVIGILPLGNLVAGTLAQHIGAPNTVILSGIFCLLESLWVARHLPLLRTWIKLKTNVPKELSQAAAQ